MCRSKIVSFVQESDPESDDSYVISAISKHKKKKSSEAKIATTKLYINKKEAANIVKIQVDTGAQCNILPAEIYIKVTGDTLLQSIKPCKKEIISYTVERRQIAGKVTLPVWHSGQSKYIKFNIIAGNYRPILSLDTSVALGIVNLKHCDILSLGIQRSNEGSSDIMKEYDDVFDGSLGKIPETHKIIVDDTVQPVVHPPRRVPVALRPRIKSKLDELVERQVIVPVTDKSGCQACWLLSGQTRSEFALTLEI